VGRRSDRRGAASASDETEEQQPYRNERRVTLTIAALAEANQQQSVRFDAVSPSV
jgi:hypothetical protein